MYWEFSQFFRQVIIQKSFWKDGEFWTAICCSIASFFWFKYDPEILLGIKNHFNDLLTITSIVFGFALAALLFYIQAASAWSRDKKVIIVAEKIVDWHVWTILSLLFLIAYILALWSFGRYLTYTNSYTLCLYSILVFLFLYCGFQIFNHSLTVWWSFRNRDKLNPPSINSGDKEI